MSVAKVIGEYTADNLIEAVSVFFSPEKTRTLSQKLGEPVDKTALGVAASAPLLLQSLARLGATVSDAEKVISLIRREAFDRGIAQEFPSAVGPGVLSEIFGSQLDSYNRVLSSFTALSPRSSLALMTNVASVILGFLGQKASSFGFDPLLFSDFLSEQMGPAQVAMPGGLAHLTGKVERMAGTKALDLPGAETPRPLNQRTSRNWTRPALITSVLLVAGMWFANRLSEQPEIPRELIVPPGPGITDSSPNPADMTPPRMVSSGNGIEDLSRFLSSRAVSELPKRILFRDLTFVTGSATLTRSALVTVDKLGQILKQYPEARVRVEGHTDDMGSPAANASLSLRRSETVRNELVRRGVAANRIEVKGSGQASPIESNATEAGRQANRRIEIVVMDL